MRGLKRVSADPRSVKAAKSSCAPDCAWRAGEKGQGICPRDREDDELCAAALVPSTFLLPKLASGLGLAEGGGQKRLATDRRRRNFDDVENTPPALTPLILGPSF